MSPSSYPSVGSLPMFYSFIQCSKEMRSSNPKLWEALLVVVFRLCEPGIVEKSRAVFMHFQHASECAKCCLNYSV